MNDYLDGKDVEQDHMCACEIVNKGQRKGILLLSKSRE